MFTPPNDSTIWTIVYVAEPGAVAKHFHNEAVHGRSSDVSEDGRVFRFAVTEDDKDLLAGLFNAEEVYIYYRSAPNV